MSVKNMPDASRPTVRYFCVGALFVFVGSVLLCALGFTIVLPFEATRFWPKVLCTVLNSSYDIDVCSCDEQMSVYDTCVSEYPCLKVYVSYVIMASTITPNLPHPTLSSRNSSSDDRQEGRRRRRSAAAAAVVDNSSTSADDAPDRGRQLAEMVDAQLRFDAVENHLSHLNASLNDSSASALVSTASPTAFQDTDNHRTSLDRLTGNGSGPMTSYRIAGGARRYATEYDFIDMTLTTTSDVNWSYVAKLYRSWDDTFLPECSLTECDDDMWNIKQARKFKSNWGRVGQSFSCFYNPDRQNVVILERTPPFAAINAVVWPCLLLLVGVSLWLGLCLGCWSLGNDAALYKEEYGGGVVSLRLQ